MNAHLNNIENNMQNCVRSFLEKKSRVQHYPTDIVLQITSRCCINPPCAICDRNIRPKEAENDLYPAILPFLPKLLKYCDRLYLFSGGEPLLSPSFFEVVNMVSLPTKVRINTNGLLLTDPIIRRIVDARCFEVINVSIDAATPEVYERMRHQDFELVVSNIRRLIKYRDDVGSKWPHAFINMTICKSNLNDISFFPDLAKKVGAEAVDYSRLHDGMDFIAKTSSGAFNYKQEMMYDKTEHDKQVTEAANKCKQMGLRMIYYGIPFYDPSLKRIDILEDRRFPGSIDAFLAGNNPYTNTNEDAPIRDTSKCSFPWMQLVIAYNGDITCCCFHDTVSGKLGNILEEDFWNIWNGSVAQRFRKEMCKTGKTRACVSNCRYLMSDKKNR